MMILLLNQIPSGKNAIIVTRTGHHYPNARFKAWREDAVLQLRVHGHIPKPALDYPLALSVKYWAGDKRTRDVSGMLDALFHLLTHAKVIKDDGLIRDVTWRWCGVNRENPKVELTLSPME